MNDFSFKTRRQKEENSKLNSIILRKNEIDSKSSGQTKKESFIKNKSFIKMKGGMNSGLNKSNRKGNLYKK